MTGADGQEGIQMHSGGYSLNVQALSVPMVFKEFMLSMQIRSCVRGITAL